MVESLVLKKIDVGAVDAALEKAERYRLLNDPEQAESICLDVLEVAPDSQRAARTLILALTDQFAQGSSWSGALARQHARALTDEYERLYYEGIIVEREGRAYLQKGRSGSFGYESLREAMALFEAAIEKRPKGNDDPILRWNSCLRTITRQRLEPRGPEAELPLE